MRSISAHIRNRSQPLTAWANTLPSAELCVGRQSTAAHSRSTSPNGSASIASLNANFGKLARAPCDDTRLPCSKGQDGEGTVFRRPNTELRASVEVHGLLLRVSRQPRSDVYRSSTSTSCRNGESGDLGLPATGPFGQVTGCLLVPGLWEAARVRAVLDCCLKHRGRKIGKRHPKPARKTVVTGPSHGPTRRLAAPVKYE